MTSYLGYSVINEVYWSLLRVVLTFCMMKVDFLTYT